MIKTLLAVTCLMLSMTGNAATVTVRGTEYDVINLVGSYNNNTPLLQSQIWWGDEGLAMDFASATGTLNGTPNCGTHVCPLAPYFAFATVEVNDAVKAIVESEKGSAYIWQISWSDEFTYAIATPSQVPLPAAAWLFISALGGLVVAKRKQLKA